MKAKTLAGGMAVLATLAIAGYGTYLLGMNRGMAMAGNAPTGASSDPSMWSVAQGEEATRRHIASGIKPGDVDPATGRKILYYHDPMVPGKRFDAPGKSPFMNMMLVPVYAGAEAVDSGKVMISPRVQQNLGVRTAEVSDGTLASEVSAIGSIAWNERDQVVIQARANAFVERLFTRATFDRVQAGQRLVELYVPDWIAAQEEFLALKRAQGSDIGLLLDAARARMRQVGMTDAQIARVEASSAVQPRITLTAPIGGVVSELAVREGMSVMAGATLFRISGTATVWAQAEIPESQAGLVRPGARARARSPSVPGEVFEGRVQALLPEVNKETRTIKARLEIANRGGRLAPGMLLNVQFSEATTKPALLVPTEAVIQTGKRTWVMVVEANGVFRPVDVEAGIESGSQTEIRRGLQRGQRVVTSSQFLLDSEASLKGIQARLLTDPPATAAPMPAAVHRTEATIEAVHGESVTLSHPPVSSLNWPAMTMDFRLPPDRPSGLAQGDKVDIEFRMDASDAPQITAIRRVAPASKPAEGKR